MGRKPSKTTIGMIIAIVSAIGGAIGSAFLTIGTSEKVLGGYIDECDAEIKKIEEGKS